MGVVVPVMLALLTRTAVPQSYSGDTRYADVVFDPSSDPK